MQPLEANKDIITWTAHKYMQDYDEITLFRTNPRVNLCCPPINMLAKPATSLDWVVEPLRNYHTVPSISMFCSRKDVWMNAVYHDTSMTCQLYLATSGLFEIFFHQKPLMMALLSACTVSLLSLLTFMTVVHHLSRIGLISTCALGLSKALDFDLKNNAFNKVWLDPSTWQAQCQDLEVDVSVPWSCGSWVGGQGFFWRSLRLEARRRFFKQQNVL